MQKKVCRRRINKSIAFIEDIYRFTGIERSILWRTHHSPNSVLKHWPRKSSWRKSTGLEDIEQVKLLSGEEGGGIKLYKGTKLIKFPWLISDTRAVFPFPIMTTLYRWR